MGNIKVMEGGRVLAFESHKPNFGPGVFVASGACVIGQTVLGEHCSVWFNTVIRGDVHKIEIGSYTNIQDNSVVHVTGGKFGTVIGDRVTIGHNAIIHGCTIGNNVLIGMGAVILDGAHIPDWSMVAAGTIVTQNKSFSEGQMILGSPGRAIRPLSEDEKKWISYSADNYANLAKKY